MSSQYPILGSRPIDQWKVTELKEELKRRKLITKGLKEDLIKRLDEAIRSENESANDDGCDSALQPEFQSVDALSTGAETNREILDHSHSINEKVDGDSLNADANDNLVALAKEECPQGVLTGGTDISWVEGNQVVQPSSVETNITVTDSVESDVSLNEQNCQKNDVPNQCEDLRTGLENEDPKYSLEDAKLKSSYPDNQVFEVNPVLGFQVKSDCISTHSASFNDKNELKDNIIADDGKIELDVKHELMQQSSSTVVSDNGKLHPMDVEERLESKVPVEATGDHNCESAYQGHKNDNGDMASSEKLNLDRSSGEDSMDEDASESKLIDSKINSDEASDKGEKTEVPMVNDGGGADVIIDNFPVGNKENNAEKKNGPALASVKRKLHVPPSIKRPTNSLRIDRFLRPFTLKAVQELLGKTGVVTSFWMDAIKTHCYVTYSSVEEAVETRNSVYDLKWPSNGGKHLVAEFVDAQEVKVRVEAPQSPAMPMVTGPILHLAVPHAPPTMHHQHQPSPRLQLQRQPLPPPPPRTLPPPPSLSIPPPAREQLPPPPPLPLPPTIPPKVDVPIVTLDDLFRKTKAVPRIYYLPLSDEQVASKLKAVGKNVKQ